MKTIGKHGIIEVGVNILLESLVKVSKISTVEHFKPYDPDIARVEHYYRAKIQTQNYSLILNKKKKNW